MLDRCDVSCLPLSDLFHVTGYKKPSHKRSSPRCTPQLNLNTRSSHRTSLPPTMRSYSVSRRGTGTCPRSGRCVFLHFSVVHPHFPTTALLARRFLIFFVLFIRDLTTFPLPDFLGLDRPALGRRQARREIRWPLHFHCRPWRRTGIHSHRHAVHSCTPWNTLRTIRILACVPAVVEFRGGTRW